MFGWGERRSLRGRGGWWDFDGLGRGIGRPGADWFLNTGLGGGGFAGVVLVGGDLLLRAEHGDGDLAVEFLDLVVVGEGGEAVGEDLDAEFGSDGDDVGDGGLAVGVGFDLEITVIGAVVGEFVEDDGGVRDGLVVVAFGDEDLDVGGLGWGFVLAAAALLGVLGAGEGRHDGDGGCELEGRPVEAEIHLAILRFVGARWKRWRDLRGIDSHFTQGGLTRGNRGLSVSSRRV